MGVLFGSDVFADSRHNGPAEYRQALRASAEFLQRSTFACIEFRRTDFFDCVERDHFGPVRFDPLNLKGLDLLDSDVVLKRCFYENAMEILDLSSTACSTK